MTLTATLLLQLLAFAAIGLVVLLLRRRSIGGDRLDDAFIAGFAHRLGLPVPESFRQGITDQVELRRNRVWRFGLAGLLLGLLAGVVVLLLGHHVIADVLPLWGVVLGAAIGSWSAVHSYRARLSPQAPPLEHERPVTVAAYTTVGETISHFCVPVMIAVACAAMWLIGSAAPDAGPGTAELLIIASCSAVVCIGVWLWFWRSERPLVRLPHFAEDQIDLAWSDAMRAVALRDLREAGQLLGLLGSTSCMLAAGALLYQVSPQVRSDPELTATLGTALLYVLGACWAVLMIPSSIGSMVRNPTLKLPPPEGLVYDVQAGTEEPGEPGTRR
ncbi:hypothetical protein [Naumannella halotolerans]|uniref:Uncharacterized protein n=1 Tax=Naumannella halotolerans TaxID=993414 RepID=A0A4R7J6W8_9ACTN|nr:hypothetical protein [Naumannella halotolerans]TDT33150.1 hypothetical protein CLV29_0753 [Naumannella halotolerans]